MTAPVRLSPTLCLPAELVAALPDVVARLALRPPPPRHPATGRFLAYDCEVDCQERCAGLCGATGDDADDDRNAQRPNQTTNPGEAVNGSYGDHGTMDETMSVADVLRKAIDVLEQRGWHQGGYVGPDGSVCAYGAINVACGAKARRTGDARSMRYIAKFSTWLSDHGGDGRIGPWNDDPARTYEDVVLAMKFAAADAEASGE